MSDKVSDKTEYEKAKEKIDEQEHTELYNAGTMNSEQYRAIIREYAMRREALALAEGERKGIAEYAKGEAERRTAIHGHGFQLGVEEGERKERNRIEGVIADKLDCYECYDVANKAQLVWAIKKAIAEE